MSEEIISAIITAAATVLSTGVLGITVLLVSTQFSRLKETNQKLIEDWEFLYKVEEMLLTEIQSSTSTTTHSKKIITRKNVAEKLGRKINYDGLSHIKKLKK